MGEKPSEWWLTNETSGQCVIYLASLAIKQSTLVRHTFEVPLYRFVVQWHPLPSHAQVIEFKVLEWHELDPKTLENRGESENLAGLLSWTINAATGALLTVLSGPLSEARIKKFCSACEEVHMKLTRQEMLALFIDYAQEAAQQVVRVPDFLILPCIAHLSISRVTPKSFLHLESQFFYSLQKHKTCFSIFLIRLSFTYYHFSFSHIIGLFLQSKSLSKW